MKKSLLILISMLMLVMLPFQNCSEQDSATSSDTVAGDMANTDNNDVNSNSDGDGSDDNSSDNPPTTPPTPSVGLKSIAFDRQADGSYRLNLDLRTGQIFENDVKIGDLESSSLGDLANIVTSPLTSYQLVENDCEPIENTVYATLILTDDSTQDLNLATKLCGAVDFFNDDKTTRLDLAGELSAIADNF